METEISTFIGGFTAGLSGAPLGAFPPITTTRSGNETPRPLCRGTQLHLLCSCEARKEKCVATRHEWTSRIHLVVVIVKPYVSFNLGGQFGSPSHRVFRAPRPTWGEAFAPCEPVERGNGASIDAMIIPDHFQRNHPMSSLDFLQYPTNHFQSFPVLTGFA